MSKQVCLCIALALAGTGAYAATSPDETFAKKAAQGGMAEVAVGQIASNQGNDPKVKEFGEKMVQDHQAANDELKTAASKSNITLPSDVSKQQQSEADKLKNMKGAAFDHEYARMMVKDHEEDVALFQKEADSGKDPNLKAYAQKTLPTLKEHLRMAKQMQSGASGRAG
ncbi:MAG TPA: DUF4142 domain-containing protein [Rudaea sp.]|nr:DUF4142 domain-containing protein [Rudaea sp.]